MTSFQFEIPNLWSVTSGSPYLELERIRTEHRIGGAV